MGNRTAKFVSALVGSIIAGAPLAAVSQNAPSASSTANAAADCLASPKGAAPQGQHWHYRLERTTKRQCWYLRAAGDKDSAKAVQATADTPPDSTASPQQTVQDARAEYVGPRRGATPKEPNATPAAATPAQQPADQVGSSAQQPVADTAWPDVSTASAAQAPQPAPTMVAAAAQPNAKPSKSPALLPPAAAEGTTDKPAGSVQMLLLVIGGALALAGILASLIYRFAGGRVRVQAADRRGHWDDWAPQDHAGSRAPWLGATPAVTPRPQPRPVDFDEARPQTAQLAAFTKEIGIIAAQSSSIRNKAAELDKADIFNGEFEIGPSPLRLAAKEIDDKKPAARDEIDRAEDVQTEDAVDVDVITAMLERLAKQGPRLREPSPEAALVNLARNQRGQSAARA
ncbi:hypothetical protein XH99_08460 [Bradyrhizobium nanningense]|uniref:Uncharacterized protein n=1 Tax=Bradyrhizobium nanningense TaxID=1325118 RepID=A0A4Q0SBR9_9BRAD|nr:hypothetical protein [Bradyrhizobium nanningense]RXH35742.1 hypothetical protein XH99_08460 [Bradyrhizobium nanningense]RXH36146.1 hypothetical protein XH84_02630 [Bradyrhizobium nanningense]